VGSRIGKGKKPGFISKCTRTKKKAKPGTWRFRWKPSGRILIQRKLQFCPRNAKAFRKEQSNFPPEEGEVRKDKRQGGERVWARSRNTHRQKAVDASRVPG